MRALQGARVGPPRQAVRKAPKEQVGPAGLRWKSPTNAYCSALIATCDLIALAFGLGLTVGVGGLAEWLYSGTVVVLLATGGLWRPRLSLRVLDDGRLLIPRLLLPLLPFALTHDGAATLRAFAHGAVVSTAFILTGRALSYSIISAARRRRVFSENTVIIGARGVGIDLAKIALDHPEYGLRPIGFLDTPAKQTDLPIPILGDVRRLRDLLGEFDVRRVLVAFSTVRDAQMVDLLRACGEARAEVHIVPRLFEVAASGTGRNTDDLWGIPLVHVRRAALRSYSWRAKRIFDVAAAAVTLALSIPLFALITLAVRLTSQGPVLFRQPRVGRGGRIINVLKFRTLQVNTDSETTWSVANDSRQTPIGPVLRKTCLDELPQLINVLRGDMSLVGPRPERPHFVNEFAAKIAGYDARHRVPTGMTGWAQIHGLRGDTSLSERVRFDNQYIERWSFTGDLVILIRTVTVIAREVLHDAGTAVARRWRGTARWEAVFRPSPVLLGPPGAAATSARFPPAPPIVTSVLGGPALSGDGQSACSL